MRQTLNMIFKRLLNSVSLESRRFLYDHFLLDDRLTGLIGPRGVGKTTLLLQVIKTQFKDLSRVFYFSADHIYFDQVTLYHFIEESYLVDGVDTFFIDEIHKYKNWSQELKNLYDGFPQIKIIFSGSSSLDIKKGSYDLSRRAKIYHLPGMSFREYLSMHAKHSIEKVPFDALVENHQRYDDLLMSVPKIKGHFNDYLTQGFYPFFKENSLSYYEKLLNVIEKTVYEDIANFYHLKTENLHHFKKILNFLASIPPGNINVHNIGKNLSIDDKTIMNYLHKLQETGLVNLIYPMESGNVGLRRPEKIFLNNTNLQYVIQGDLASTFDVGTVRELFFIQAFRGANINVWHSKKGDYLVGGKVFEVGGKNKNKKQIKDVENSFLVKADIMIGSKREIPLMLMGLLY